MMEEKQTSERLGTPDTGAHDKMQGDKLKSGGVPARPGTGDRQDKQDEGVSEDQVGGGV
jgi:hypothetical protein